MNTRILLIITCILSLTACAIYRMSDPVVAPSNKVNDIYGYVFGKFFLNKRYETAFYTPVIENKSAVRLFNMESHEYTYIELNEDQPYQIFALVPGAYRIDGAQSVSTIGIPDSPLVEKRQITVGVEFDIMPNRMVYIGDYHAVMHPAQGTFQSKKAQLRVSDNFSATVDTINAQYPSFRPFKKFNPIR